MDMSTHVSCKVSPSLVGGVPYNKSQREQQVKIVVKPKAMNERPLEKDDLQPLHYDRGGPIGGRQEERAISPLQIICHWRLVLRFFPFVGTANFRMLLLNVHTFILRQFFACARMEGLRFTLPPTIVYAGGVPNLGR